MKPELSSVWDHETDVVVVGLGGAGACAAIEAHRAGAEVVVLERFSGGGATAISGGVVYAGGGTDIQKQAGVKDDTESMRAYLDQEIEGVVSQETIRAFCNGSAESLRWLTELGLQFEGSLCPHKTSYPNDNYFLYYSGNEAAEPYRSHARPAPRGHRVKGKGLPGRAFYEPLHKEVVRQGTETRLHSRASELILDDSGRVVGVLYQEIPAGIWSRLHGSIENLAARFALFLPAIANRLRNVGRRIEERHAEARRIRARQGVILTTGGFINNPRMVEEYAPDYMSGLPIGTAGCSGDGIELGQAIGAKLQHMQNISAWLFLNPPHAFMHGILIDQRGKRFVNESLYGAVIGGQMVEQANGMGILIIDSTLKKLGRSQIGRGQTQTFQTVPALVNLMINCRKANDIEELARICHCDMQELKNTLEEYTEAARSGAPDAFG
ncbi:MAG: FAD-binding protein, partial [Myxococcota bacterium]